MIELYGLRATRHHVRLALLQGLALTLVFTWSAVRMFQAAPEMDTGVAQLAMIAAYPVAAMLLALFWRGLEPELSRVDLDFAATITRRVLCPLVAGWAVAGAITHALWLRGHIHGTVLPFVPVLALGALSTLAAWGQLGAIAWFLRWQREGVRHAARTLEQHAREHEPRALARIRQWLQWWQGDAPPVPTTLIRGTLFPGLARKPWYDKRDVPGWEALESAYGVIRSEILAVYAQQEGFRRYNPYGTEDRNWRVFPLFKDNRKHAANCARCPRTVEVIEQLIGGVTRDVVVSVLEPDAYIAPHRDSGNQFLTCHFGIDVPEGCEIRVGAESRPWIQGQPIVFDTSFEHEAWNHGQRPRIVLLFEVLHPELTTVEREFFARLLR
jgi:aspartyl/asparaginyl beta-hydroxylase (cupin superfamily)